MTLNPEFVTVVAATPYTGFESVQVTASMRKACREFQLQMSEHPGEFSFPPGTPIKIFANGTLMLDGYVNRYQPRISAKAHLVTVLGRSAAQDVVDCAAIHKPGYWENRTPDQIGNELDHFGVGITAEIPLKPIPYHQLYQGETVHDTLERSLRDQKATMLGAERGIKITNASVAKRHAGGLIEGHNILEADATLSDDRQFSETAVKGQSRHGYTDNELKIHEKARNSAVRRYRPKLIVSETDTNKSRARSRAEHDKNRQAGFGVSATIEVQGWRDDGGLVFQPNYLIYVASPSLKIAGDMLIEAVTWKQDKSGSKASIHLVDPKAYEGKGGKNSSDPSWTGGGDGGTEVDTSVNPFI